MEESKSSTRLLLTSAVIMLVVLVTGPLGYKFGFAALMSSITSVMIGVVGGFLVSLVSLGMWVVAFRENNGRDKLLLIVSLVIGMLPLAAMAPQIFKAQLGPTIHDITTDTHEPPKFSAVIALRADAANDLRYGTATLSPEKHADLQLGAYPNVTTIYSKLDISSAVRRAKTVLNDQGLKIVDVNVEEGRVEATATTFWFGFKDDVVVRVREYETGSKIDVRSVSRVGANDLGANAARIELFLNAF